MQAGMIVKAAGGPCCSQPVAHIKRSTLGDALSGAEKHVEVSVFKNTGD